MTPDQAIEQLRARQREEQRQRLIALADRQRAQRAAECARQFAQKTGA